MTVRIPIRVQDGAITYAEKGEMPKLKEGATGTLHVSDDALADTNEHRRFTDGARQMVLPSSASVWMLMRPRPEKEPLDAEQEDYLQQEQRPPMPNDKKGVVVRVLLREPLWAQHAGTPDARVEECLCHLPGRPDVEADSLNQAYTRLSEVFEPHRTTHTGSIYTKTFWRDTAESRWYSLDALRKGEMPTTHDAPERPDLRPWWLNPDGMIGEAWATINVREAKKDGSQEDMFDEGEKWEADLYYVSLTGDVARHVCNLGRRQVLKRLDDDGYVPYDPVEHLDPFTPPNEGLGEGYVEESRRGLS